MQAHEREPLGVGGARTGIAALDPVRQAAEGPGVRKCAAADGDAVAAGLGDHAGRVGDRPDVAVAEDGDSFDRLDHAADAVVVHTAGKALLAGAAVDGDGRNANLLELAGEIWRG